MTFNSVYEITNNLSTVAGQHMIEYFTGNSLDDRWTWNGEFDSVMADSVNGGLKVFPTTSGNNAIVYMNDKRQFNYVNSGFITTIYCEGTAGRTDVSVGFTGGNEWSGIPYGSQSKCCFKQDTGAIALSGSVSDGSSETHTALTGSLTMFAEFVNLKATTHSTHCEFSRNGVLGAIGTANLPDSKMQIGCEVRNIGAGAGAAYAYWNYVEAWNN